MKRTLAVLLTLAMLFSCLSFASAEGTTETIQVAYMLTMNAAEQRQMVQDAVNQLLAKKGLGVQWNLSVSILHPGRHKLT